ncbi:MAG: DNA mismatch repair protein MutL, partial [Clostridiales bacterium]|nr:DNA mismatch repair protein MutL [Clostridiales bacterium]
DAGVCFTRHATSKLKDERSLEAIGTMGFRGEALAAIAAVSRAELITRRRGSKEGVRLTLEGGEILEMVPWGCPEGTTIIIRDLFYNTPARLKFMKSDRAEGSSCLSLALRCALGRPEVSVRLIKDGKEEFFSPGDGRQDSAVYSLLGRDSAKQLLKCASKDEGISVTGFTGSPRYGSGNRSKQFFFCNGRSIKSQLLQAAVEQAYKNTLLTGRFPACVIYLEISPASVDVNVHPTKLEVKFREERRVFDMVYNAVLSALFHAEKTAEPFISSGTKAVLSPKKDFFQAMPAAEFRKKTGEPAKTSDLSSPERKPSAPTLPQNDRGTVLLYGRGSAEKDGGTRLYDSRSSYNAVYEAPNELAGNPPSAQLEIVQGESACEREGIIVSEKQEEDPLFSEATADFRLVGEAMKTYIIVEKGEELIFIDKHAAHERMIFDRLKNQGHEVMSQTLMLPVPLKLTAAEAELLEKNMELMRRLGFEIEPFGENSMILRAVPADVDAADAAPMVEEICEKLDKCAVSETEYIDEILHTVACKAAIKAGWKTSDGEFSDIAEKVLAGEVRYCPHGRPVWTSLTKRQLDKEFSRII